MLPVMMLGGDETRRKHTWRNETPRSRGRRAASPSAAPAVSSPPPASGEKKRRILSGGLFSKRRSSTATKPKPVVEPSAEAIARGVEILQSIFPKWDSAVLQVMLEASAYIMEDSIAAILGMEEAEEESNLKREQANGFAMNRPIKNVLPDDFLRLPDGDDILDDERSDDDRDDDESTTEHTESTLGDSVELEGKGDTATISGDEEHSNAIDTTADDQSDKSSALAEDDGTLYGKQFESDNDELQEDVVTPVLDSDVVWENEKIVSDSMNQKFIPAELREERESIIDTAQMGVIQRSRLDLTEAEKRIRHREPHLVFELLTTASAIYRNGIISSLELDKLRSMIVSKIQPSKMLADMSMTMNNTISDYEWQSLILKAKGLRQALSIRIVHNAPKTNNRAHGHMEYLIRVVDVETGVVWFTKKRFKELYKLHRKLCRLSGRVNECVFPARRNHSRTSAQELACDRAPLLEDFLRTAAALVTPPPITFLHGCAVKHLQQFLDIPHDSVLVRNQTQPIARELRVFVYHTVNDRTSPEGKACAKFMSKLKHKGLDPGKNALDEVGTVLDGVQEYMLEHRFQEMKELVDRLMVYYTTADVAEQTLGRRNSYVSHLLDEDMGTNSEKLQQLISDAIRHELEEKICVPLMSELGAYLKHRVLHKERQFRQRIFQLRGKPQSYFGIPVSKISLSSWRTVIDSIKEIDNAFLPLDKMRRLVATAHQIHALHRSERQMYHPKAGDADSVSEEAVVVTTMDDVVEETTTSPDAPSEEMEGKARTASDPPEEDVLSGDDFLPIFIYVLVHSDLATPIMTQVLLNRLCDPEKRRSESGYYLATFEAALHHILSNDGFQGT